MSKLSALQAFIAGRKEVPGYVSGKLLTAQTRKGRDCWWDHEEEAWVYYIPANDPNGGTKTLPADYRPKLGSACFLGAMGVAMGAELSELTGLDTYYAHPDFFVNERDRDNYPEGFVYQGGGSYAELKKSLFPCVGHDGTGYNGERPIPEVIAHLNDAHDPRYRSAAQYEKPKVADPWPEERIVEWLRSLGYNGDH